ncbi:MAG: ATP-dependent DNA ligase [Nanoarchaeota archaeon]
MDYSDLVKIYQELEKTTKRLEKTDIVSNFIKKIPSESLSYVVYLLEGRIFPEWDERKIGFSSKLMIKAISQATGISAKDVEIRWSKVGDLGDVAEELMNKKKQATLFSSKLTIRKIIENIRKLSELEGEGTVDRKISLVAELLTSSYPTEARFIVRTVLEDLRIGIAAGVMRDAIAKAFNKEIKEIGSAFDLTVDYGEVAKLAKNNELKAVSLKPGKPIKMMLSIIASNVEEGFEYLGKPMQCEFKLDGFRLQIHKHKGEIKLFTRRMENVTKQFPDLINTIKTHVKGDSFILDAEAVGYDKKTKRYLPFQSISQRIRRKYDIEEVAEKFPVELNVFDIVYYKNKSLMNENLKERRKLIESIIKQEIGKIRLTEKLVTSNINEAKKFYQEALKGGTEGIMMKNMNSEYRPGRYVGGWMKLKQILEPLDLVIVGAEYGTGKRAGFLSSYVLACKSGNKLLECGMVSTGVKEKVQEEGITYNELTKLLKPSIIEQKGKYVKVKPKIVIEVGYEEIQKSPTYSSGFALRFPKFLRLRSQEKTVKDINSIEDIRRIYNSQRGKK